MHVSGSEQVTLQRIFSLLADDLNEREIRQSLGVALLDLMAADHFASFVWDEGDHRFSDGIWLNMSDRNLATYDEWYQYRDPITFQLQARQHPTAVSEVMPHRELIATEFFNDFLRRDGLHWGINVHAFDGAHALGDLRIWRARHRREFEPHDKDLLALIEPALIVSLKRARQSRRGTDLSRVFSPSPRERQVALAVRRGMTDKQIAREMDVSVSTVRTYIHRLFEKTGETRRAGLIRWLDRLS